MILIRSGIGIAAVSLEGYIIRCNKEFAEVFDTSPHVLNSKSVAVLTGEEDKQVTSESFERLVSGEIDHHETVKTYKSLSGEIRKCKLFTMVILNEVAEPAYLLSFIYRLPNCSDSDVFEEAWNAAFRQAMLMVKELNNKEVKIVNNNNDGNIADNGASLQNNTSNDTKIFMWIAIAGIVIAAILAGSDLALRLGGVEVDVNNQNQVEEKE